MKFCKDCKYFKPVYPPSCKYVRKELLDQFADGYISLCTNENTKVRHPLYMIDGSMEYSKALTARESILCGELARYYEPKL